MFEFCLPMCFSFLSPSSLPSLPSSFFSSLKKGMLHLIFGPTNEKTSKKCTLANYPRGWPQQARFKWNLYYSFTIELFTIRLHITVCYKPEIFSIMPKEHHFIVSVFELHQHHFYEKLWPCHPFPAAEICPTHCNAAVAPIVTSWGKRRNPFLCSFRYLACLLRRPVSMKTMLIT